MNDNLAVLRASKNLAKRIYKQQTSGDVFGGSVGEAGLGYDLWDRSAWERVKAQTGSYPFGPQADGGFIHPPTMEGAPEWAYVLMGRRVPPVGVGHAQGVQGIDY